MNLYMFLLVAALLRVLSGYQRKHQITRSLRTISALKITNTVGMRLEEVITPARRSPQMLLMHGGEAACLWAGDSRCYLLRDGVLYQCTREHTLRQEKIDNGELTAPEARRMVRGNIITNAVGARDALRLDEVRFSLRGGDKFLLCSDGLSNLLGPDALAARLARTSAREAAEDMARAVDGVPQPDNITLVAVFVSSLR